MLPDHYSNALRCVGQALEKKRIEVFDLRCDDDEFRLQCGEPEPPYSGLIELRYALRDILALDREARARRRDSFKTVRFESLPEMLRAVGRYVDKRNGRLLRVWNSEPTRPEESIKIEYRTREREVLSEEFSISFIYERSVRMYKERARASRSA